MELIKLTDYEGTAQYLNKDYIISIRPFNSFEKDDPRQSRVEYGSGFVDAIYMKENANVVAGMIEGAYFR